MNRLVVDKNKVRSRFGIADTYIFDSDFADIFVYKSKQSTIYVDVLEEIAEEAYEDNPDVTVKMWGPKK